MTTAHPEYLDLLAAVCDPARLADDTPRLAHRANKEGKV